MSGGVPSSPSGGDGLPGRGLPRRKSGTGFSWSAPSPSSAEVAGLEQLFPEVIQLPLEEIDKESEDWSSSGVIVRPLSRWVPIEAILREFRRAGLAGKIDSISLAYRTYLLKFELLEARSAALMQPWTVNGQPLAMEPWRPDFVPADSALLSALLWIRLPNLPIEYWKEETLRCILSVAGQFVEADVFTKERRRGSFARACVRVDLSKPLRPGARFRGRGPPFWQQFAFEQVDCICPNCGSLHLTGPCSSSPDQGSSASASPFGPWMAALRLRKASSVSGHEGVSQGLNSGVGAMGAAPAGGMTDPEGWRVPKKVARRRPGIASSSHNSGIFHTVIRSEQEPCRGPPSVPVTVHSEKQGSVHPPVDSSEGFLIEDSHSNPLVARKGRKSKNLSVILPEKGGSSDAAFHFSAKCSENLNSQALVTLSVLKAPQKGSILKKGMKGNSTPHSSAGSDQWAGRSKIRVDANPASLKRARAVEVIGPMVSSKDSKGKERASSEDLGPSVVAVAQTGAAPPPGYG